MRNASFIVSALKKIHVKFTNTNVIIQFSAGCNLSKKSFLCLTIIIKSPCNNPHKINVQLAPCHKPLTKYIIKIFTYNRNLPFLFPPSGMYKYFVKNLVSVICHRFQKSVIVNALYGELKFKGKSIFNI